jgi:WD40 repeat protein
VILLADLLVASRTCTLRDLDRVPQGTLRAPCLREPQRGTWIVFEERRTTIAGRRWFAAAGLIAGLSLVAGSACTWPASPRGATGPTGPRGSIIGFTQNTANTPLVAFDVREATVRSAGGDVRSPLASAAAVSGDGLTAVAVTARGTASAFRLTPGQSAAPVGPAYDGRAQADYRSLAVAGDLVVVADCDAVVVLDTTGSSGWRPVGRGCWAAPSPDGADVVFSPDGIHVFERSLEATRARALFDIHGLDLGTRDPARFFGAPAWGPDGIAFAVVAGTQAAVYLRSSDGSLVRLLQERLLKTVRPPILAWQPNGRLLAMMDDLGSGGVLRTFDAASGTGRVVALDPLGFQGLAWSPDGSSLATLTSGHFLLVVGTDDVWRARVYATWDGVLGWMA